MASWVQDIFHLLREYLPYSYIVQNQPPVTTYTVVPTTLWTHVEPSIGLICSCQPVNGDFFQNFLFPGSWSRKKYGYWSDPVLSVRLCVAFCHFYRVQFALHRLSSSQYEGCRSGIRRTKLLHTLLIRHSIFSITMVLQFGRKSVSLGMRLLPDEHESSFLHLMLVRCKGPSYKLRAGTRLLH